MYRFVRCAVAILGVAPLALILAACGPGGLGGSLAPAATATATPPVFGPEALATLDAVRNIEDFVHRCGEGPRDALATLAMTYPHEPLVRAAALKIMPECQDFGTLAEIFERIPIADRTDSDRIALARLYIRNLSKFAEAEREIRPAIEHDPNNADAVSLLTSALYYQGRLAEAMPMVDRLWDVMVNQQNTDIMTMRADAFIDAGQLERATRILDQVLAWNPQHAFALNTMRKARIKAGDDAGAAAISATKEALDTAGAAQQKSMTEIQRRFQDLVKAFDAFKYDEAAAIANELIQQAPNNSTRAELYNTLGTIYQMSGHMDDALKARNEASRLLAAGPGTAPPPESTLAEGTPVIGTPALGTPAATEVRP